MTDSMIEEMKAFSDAMNEYLPKDDRTKMIEQNSDRVEYAKNHNLAIDILQTKLFHINEEYSYLKSVVQHYQTLCRNQKLTESKHEYEKSLVKDIKHAIKFLDENSHAKNELEKSLMSAENRLNELEIKKQEQNESYQELLKLKKEAEDKLAPVEEELTDISNAIEKLKENDNRNNQE